VEVIPAATIENSRSAAASLLGNGGLNGARQLAQGMTLSTRDDSMGAELHVDRPKF
jgi:hypothetical protein